MQLEEKGTKQPNIVTQLGSGSIASDGGIAAGNRGVTAQKIESSIIHTGDIVYHYPQLDPKDKRDQQNHSVLRQSVSRFWIDGVLKKSLHNEVLITLDLEDKPGAVDNRPWDMILQTPKQSNCALPPGTKISHVFDQQEQRLLILGSPGSGKTTMLLELASTLLKRAENDPTHPTPVVFNLSSWAVTRLSIAEWLVSELNEKYQISKKVAQTWVDNGALMLLLDGLDEVQWVHRDACVSALNAFCRNSMMRLAVCSRIVDYADLGQQLQLSNAILLQPLTPMQVDGYFEQIGDGYAGIREALRRNAVLQEMAQSPLTLSIMTLAYQGISSTALAEQEATFDHQKKLFDVYIQRMFERRSPEQPYTQKQTIGWLTWLAKNMDQYQLTIFLIERLQPNWLQIRSRIWLYRLSGGLIFGLIFGPIGRLIGGLSGELSVGLISGLCGGLIFGLNDIETTEQLIFSWRINKKKLLFGLGSGLTLGLIFGLIFGLSDKQLVFLWKIDQKELFSGLIAGLIFGLIFGLSRELIQKKETTQYVIPNQGIWQSAKNMWIGGL
ncbi:MAG: NACHT domain-containing protein, partial [Caldilineaceae bacterium]|nr:NACHT domain-containing protein [Caldilineaceae bacterium]